MTQQLQQNNAEMQECIRNCQDCHTICLGIIVYCLQAGGAHAEATHIRRLLDCAEICETSANFMIRDSAFHAETCRACATICEQCATECENFGEDAQMQTCAQVCHQCADSCRQMAGMAMAA